MRNYYQNQFNKFLSSKNININDDRGNSTFDFEVNEEFIEAFREFLTQLETKIKKNNDVDNDNDTSTTSKSIVHSIKQRGF